MHFDPSAYELTENEREDVALANSTVDILKSLRLAAVAEADFAGYASWALASYTQYWLYRIAYLADGAISEWNARRPMNVAVLLRAIAETIVVLPDVVDQGGKCLDAGDLHGFFRRVEKATYGAREKAFVEQPDAINIKTVIERIDKRIPGLLYYYGLLCEVTHPNADGLILFGDDSTPQTISLTEDHRAERFVLERALAGFSFLAFARVFFGELRVVGPKVEDLERQYGRHPASWPRATKNGA